VEPKLLFPLLLSYQKGTSMTLRILMAASTHQKFESMAEDDPMPQYVWLCSRQAPLSHES
jgi:hypothetical protein